MLTFVTLAVGFFAGCFACLIATLLMVRAFVRLKAKLPVVDTPATPRASQVDIHA